MERDNNGIIFSAVIPLILDDSEKKKKKRSKNYSKKSGKGENFQGRKDWCQRMNSFTDPAAKLR